MSDSMALNKVGVHMQPKVPNFHCEDQRPNFHSLHNVSACLRVSNRWVVSALICLNVGILYMTENVSYDHVIIKFHIHSG